MHTLCSDTTHMWSAITLHGQRMTTWSSRTNTVTVRASWEVLPSSSSRDVDIFGFCRRRESEQRHREEGGAGGAAHGGRTQRSASAGFYGSEVHPQLGPCPLGHQAKYVPVRFFIYLESKPL